jgi:hypothetical protein
MAKLSKPKSDFKRKFLRDSSLLAKAALPDKIYLSAN